MLYHFSEEADICAFVPRPLAAEPEGRALVWAIDGFHSPHYYLPRDCPRACFWQGPNTTDEDVERFFGHSAVRHVIVVESGWLTRIRRTSLFRYTLPTHQFSLQDKAAGYYTSVETIEPSVVEPMGDLIDAIVSAGIELRITPSLWPIHRAIRVSTLGFSLIRMRNAEMH